VPSLTRPWLAEHGRPSRGRRLRPPKTRHFTAARGGAVRSPVGPHRDGGGRAMMTDAANRAGGKGVAYFLDLLIIATGGAGMAAAIRASEPGANGDGLTQTEARAAGRAINGNVDRDCAAPRGCGRIAAVWPDQARGGHGERQAPARPHRRCECVGFDRRGGSRVAPPAMRPGGRLHPQLTWAKGIKLAGQTFTKDVAKLSCCADRPVSSSDLRCALHLVSSPAGLTSMATRNGVAATARYDGGSGSCCRGT